MIPSLEPVVFTQHSRVKSPKDKLVMKLFVLMVSLTPSKLIPERGAFTVTTAVAALQPMV